MHFQCVLLLLCYGVGLVKCQISIPERLQECYQNGTVQGVQLPMNLRVLIDLVQKAERYSYTTMDMRRVATSLLHRFRFDGIEYQDDVSVKEGISPFSGTGSQRARNKIIEELIPGDAQVFPSDALTLVERCNLHRAISSTIWDNPSADEDKLCENGPTEKITGRSKTGEGKKCPVEDGVIITPYGTVAPGTIIASIAASLQPQNVAIKMLINQPKIYNRGALTTELPNLNYNKEEVDLIVPKSQMIFGRSMWFQSFVASPAKIDNVWAATLAGDLGEMAVYQGPIVGPQMTLGATGFWNSTMQPRIYYLTDKHGSLDATRAEIIGGIDGLIIAKNLQTWIDNFHSLRLSQVLDMYYSHGGVTFDKNVKACLRANAFEHVAPRTILDEQTYALAHILAYRNSVAYMTEEALQRMVGYAVDAFSTYADKYLFTESHCHNQGFRPKLEVIVAFDGTWSRDYTADFISVLIEDLDVSRYGSKMGIMHGATGEWLVNVTNSPASVFYAVSNFTNITWPAKLNYTRVLEEIGAYLNNTWEQNSKNHIIGGLGQVIILLAPRTTLSDEELRSATSLIQKIRAVHRDVQFLYYGSEIYSDSFKELLLSDEDHLIRSLQIDDINKYLLSVPRVLRPPPCNSNITQGVKDQIEDYIAPERSITYRLHPHWRNNTKKVIVTVHSVGYGSMKVCSWNEWKKNGPEEGFYCKELAGHNEISMNDYSACTDTEPCPNTYYRIQNVTSLYKCTEIDCKTPDEVRFIIRVENLSCSSSATTLILKSSISILSCLLFMISQTCVLRI